MCIVTELLARHCWLLSQCLGPGMYTFMNQHVKWFISQPNWNNWHLAEIEIADYLSERTL